MAKIHGRSTRFYINGSDLSAYFTSAEAADASDTAEASGFGDTDKSYLAGLRAGSFRLQGHFDTTSGATGVDTILNTALQAATDPIITIMRGTAIDTHGEAGVGDQLDSLSRTAPIGGIVGLSASFKGSGGIDHVRAASAKGTITPAVVPGTTAAWNGGTATALGAVGYLQVFDVPAGTPVVTIEHSADGVSGWAALMAFAGVASAGAPQAQRATVAGAVQPYQRVTVAAGTIHAHVSIFQPIA